jgi:hypothetical protein
MLVCASSFYALLSFNISGPDGHANVLFQLFHEIIENSFLFCSVP